MSLRRKVINFEKKFAELQMTLDAIFSFSTVVDAHRISGMNMYQLVYDMCNAIPRPFTDRLFAGIAEYIDKHTVGVCEVSQLLFALWCFFMCACIYVYLCLYAY
ncbi:hypothetical protein BDB00DRAFT_371277 [Zychaea mexicana]|uniref:uncharacterized protein n=1 Tax=Zychaea mexicana TaxID=64656 RepID=UPI0022FF2DBE|nr:uncharacterized protein BDB00DRAFT_371277 [Zychaea mexicana]KAI9493422.1 hypothetical protein BDB00DRAFT_371277 [Zychaea mexicana]